MRIFHLLDKKCSPYRIQDFFNGSFILYFSEFKNWTTFIIFTYFRILWITSARLFLFIFKFQNCLKWTKLKFCSIRHRFWLSGAKMRRYGLRVWPDFWQSTILFWASIKGQICFSFFEFDKAFVAKLSFWVVFDAIFVKYAFTVVAFVQTRKQIELFITFWTENFSFRLRQF
jgi:hypothetical protein